VNPLTKILVALPNHWAEHRTEQLWARRVGDDLFRVESVPFFAYGLNYGDVVRADSAGSVVREVVRRSGHTTLRVVFRGMAARERCVALLSELAPLKVSFEAWGDGFFALDVAPDGDVDAVLDRLDSLENKDVLGFETCEARSRGSFDDDEDHSSLRPG
jgi:hypothetical protein